MNTVSANSNQMPLFEDAASVSSEEFNSTLAQAEVLRAKTLAEMVSGFFASIERRIRVARNQRALQQLSDSVLADIGVHRSQIPSIAREVADGTYYRNQKAEIISVPAERPASTKNDEPELPLAA